MQSHLILTSRELLQEPLQHLSSQSLVSLSKAAILDAIWGDPSPLYDTIKPSIHPYFDYFETKCRHALQTWTKYEISELRLHHVTTICKMVLQGNSRDQIENHMSTEWEMYSDCLTISSEVIDLSVRLLLMIPVWSFWQGMSPGETTLTWVDGTIQGAFGRHFKRSMEKEDNVRVQLGKDFTARNIEQVAYMRIVWTDNLLDHLLVTSGEYQDVKIFHHASFLLYQKDSNVYPEGLISETLRTLSLLLPADDPKTEQAFIPASIEYNLDYQASKLPPLRTRERGIENFDFWRDRLVNLKQHYDDMALAKRNTTVKGLMRYFSKLRS